MISVRKAGPQDCLRIWRWRNEPAVRKVSFQTGKIPLAVHKAWYFKKIRDKKSQILIGRNTQGRPFGFARIDQQKAGKGEVHIAVTRAWRGKGLGLRLLERACRYGFKQMRLKEITAQIKPDNPRSILVFEQAGFKQAGTKAGVSSFKLRRPS